MYSNTRTAESKESLWDDKDYGRYYWVYIIAPLIASVVAGSMAKAHEKRISSKRYGDSAPDSFGSSEALSTKQDITTIPYTSPADYDTGRVMG